jgi:hypothetical protein
MAFTTYCLFYDEQMKEVCQVCSKRDRNGSSDRQNEQQNKCAQSNMLLNISRERMT